MTKLIIVETPAQAEALRGILARDWQVEAAGHTLGVPPRDRLGVDLTTFELKITFPPDQQARLHDLQAAAAEASALYLATRPDAGGEALAWQLHQHLDTPLACPVYRIWLTSYEPATLRQALARPRPLDTALANAHQARQVIERLVGYGLAPLASQALGRYCAVSYEMALALRLLANRSREDAPATWAVTATCRLPGAEDTTLTARLQPAGELASDEAEALVAALSGQALTVTDMQTVRRRIYPPPPLNLSLLLQAASEVLGFAPAYTQTLAWQLYESGWISYPLADDLNVAPAVQQAVRRHLATAFGPDYLPAIPPRYTLQSASAQRHGAIRPVEWTRPATALKDDTRLLYTLILERFWAAQLAPARHSVQHLILTAPQPVSGEPLHFQAQQARPDFPGWQQCLEPNEKVTSPASWSLAVGQAVTPVAWQTHPVPARPPYTVAALLADLTEHGVPAARLAAILPQLQQQKMVDVNQQGVVTLTDFGLAVDDLLRTHFSAVLTPAGYRQLAQALDEVARGERELAAAVADFWQAFQPALQAFAAQTVAVSPPAGGDADACPRCGQPLVHRQQVDQLFVACQDFPRCPYTRGLKRQPLRLKAEAGDT